MKFPVVGSLVLFSLYLAFKFLPKEMVNAILSGAPSTLMAGVAAERAARRQGGCAAQIRGPELPAAPALSRGPQQPCALASCCFLPGRDSALSGLQLPCPYRGRPAVPIPPPGAPPSKRTHHTQPTLCCWACWPSWRASTPSWRRSSPATGASTSSRSGCRAFPWCCRWAVLGASVGWAAGGAGGVAGGALSPCSSNPSTLSLSRGSCYLKACSSGSGTPTAPSAYRRAPTSRLPRSSCWWRPPPRPSASGTTAASTGLPTTCWGWPSGVCVWGRGVYGPGAVSGGRLLPRGRKAAAGARGEASDGSIVPVLWPWIRPCGPSLPTAPRCAACSIQGIEHLSLGAVQNGVILLCGLFFYGAPQGAASAGCPRTVRRGGAPDSLVPFFESPPAPARSTASLLVPASLSEPGAMSTSCPRPNVSLLFHQCPSKPPDQSPLQAPIAPCRHLLGVWHARHGQRGQKL